MPPAGSEVQAGVARCYDARCFRFDATAAVFVDAAAGYAMLLFCPCRCAITAQITLRDYAVFASDYA